jgi:hypothetical protein
MSVATRAALDGDGEDAAKPDLLSVPRALPAGPDGHPLRHLSKSLARLFFRVDPFTPLACTSDSRRPAVPPRAPGAVGQLRAARTRSPSAPSLSTGSLE